MIWNCDGEVKEIKFISNKRRQGYYCWVAESIYVWEASFRNAGPWDWLRKGYNIELAEWV